jgi:hypothetical protein
VSGRVFLADMHLQGANSVNDGEETGESRRDSSMVSHHDPCVRMLAVNHVNCCIMEVDYLGEKRAAVCLKFA